MISLDSATYVVPDHGFGVIHNLPVGDVSPEVFSELLESTAAEGGYFSAELGPRTAQEGFAVRIDDSLVGHLSAADSQAYALFDWILSAGLHPHATAHVSMTDASGEEWPTLNLLLPAPHLCIPANNPPAQRWTMLPGETTATMTEFSKDVTGFPQTDEHYLVTSRTRGFLRQKAVDVYVNSTFLGSLPRDAAREIAPAVLDCTKSGRLAIAHGYFHYNADDRPALTIYAHNAANKHHAGLVLGIVAGGAAIMSAVTAARAQAAPAVPGGTTAGATTAGASATSGFSVTSAVGASGAVTSNLLAAAGVAVLVGGGATVATNLLSDDEALSDSTAPAPEDSHFSLDSSHFDGNGPKRPAHPATPRIHDAGPTSDTSPQPPLADAPSSPTPHHHTYPSQTTKKPSATHSPHADHSQTHAPASDNRRGHHSEPRGGHRGEDSQAISRAASAAAAAASAAADNVDSARTSAPAPAPAPSQTTPASTPSSSSEPAPQVAAAKASTATSSSSQSAEPSQTTESTKSTTSAEPSSAASSPAEPSDLPTSSTSTSEKTTSEKTTAETTTAASTEKQTTEPSSSATSSATSEPTSEPTQAADPSTPTSASSTSTSAQPEPESSKPASSEPKPSESTAPTTTSPLLTSESEPEPAPDTTIPGSELEPTPEPEEPGRPEEPKEPTTPPKVIVIVEN